MHFKGKQKHIKFHKCKTIYLSILSGGILSAKTTFEEKPKKSHGHIRHPSEDFLKDFSIKKPVKTEAMDTAETSSKNSRSNSLTASPIHIKKELEDASSSPSSSGRRAEKSARYSDIPSNLTNVDSSTFRINTKKEPEPDPKAVVRDAFEHGKGALLERKPSVSSNDPLNSLDPLWTLKH